MKRDIQIAKTLWTTLTGLPWTQETLTNLGINVFSKLPWEKLNPETKVVFLKLAAGCDPLLVVAPEGAQTPAESPVKIVLDAMLGTAETPKEEPAKPENDKETPKKNKGKGNEQPTS